ncbi:MAG: methyltransferase domain-containing protein [Bacteroidetes bacterium]|nr:methyltransferase domain-containing protein [Bacteroidota bacterium]
MEIQEINSRYSELSNSDCCLSCGSAIDHSKAQAGEKCVDLGSGRGNDVLRLAEMVGETGFVYGIDFADGMLEKARKNAAKFNVKNVSFIKSELEDIDIPSGSIDLVISNCTINHAKDKRKVWKEIFRILNPNGRFVVSDIYSMEEVPAEYKNDPVAISECWAGAVTRREYLETVIGTGFKGCDIIEESNPYEKGKIKVSSLTIIGSKKSTCSCCH